MLTLKELLFLFDSHITEINNASALQPIENQYSAFLTANFGTIQVQENASAIDNLINAITKGLGSIDLGGILDMVTGLGGMLGGLVGDLMGGEEATPEEDAAPEYNANDTTTDDTTSSQNSTSSNNSSNSNQSVNGAPIEVEGGNFGLWLAIIIATLAILGLLVIIL